MVGAPQLTALQRLLLALGISWIQPGRPDRCLVDHRDDSSFNREFLAVYGICIERIIIATAQMRRAGQLPGRTNPTCLEAGRQRPGPAASALDNSRAHV
jgi:hypothetical protein